MEDRSDWLGLGGRRCVGTGPAGGIGRAIALECDTCDEKSVDAACAEARRRAGPAEILVNNAGFLRPAAIGAVTRADWDAMLAVNLTGYLLCAQAFGAAMLEAGRGSIVHVASVAASRVQAGSGGRSATKAGILPLLPQLAVE